MFGALKTLTTNSRLQRLLTYVFLGLLPTQLGYHFWPKEILVAGLRIDYLSPTLYLTDILVIGILFLEALKALLVPSLLKQGIKNLWLQLGLAIVLWGSVQAFWVNPVLPQLVTAIKFAFACFLIGIISHLHLPLKTVAKIFSVQIVFIGLLVSLQYFHQGSLDGLMYWLGERHLNMSTPGVALENNQGTLRFRPYGTFSHPNTLAGFILILTLWIMLSGQIKSGTVRGLLWLLSGWVLYLAYSQAAWLVAGLLGVGYWLKKGQIGQKFFPLPWSLALAVFNPLILIKLPQSWQTDAISVRNSLFLQLEHLSWWEWLGGLGWQGFLMKLSTVNQPVLGRLWLQPLHNCVWLWLTSTGLLFTGVMAAWCAVCRPWRYLKTNSLIIIAAIVALSSFDHYWLTQPQTLYLLVFIVADGLDWHTV